MVLFRHKKSKSADDLVRRLDTLRCSANWKEALNGCNQLPNDSLPAQIVRIEAELRKYKLTERHSPAEIAIFETIRQQIELIKSSLGSVALTPTPTTATVSPERFSGELSLLLAQVNALQGKYAEALNNCKKAEVHDSLRTLPYIEVKRSAIMAFSLEQSGDTQTARHMYELEATKPTPQPTDELSHWSRFMSERFFDMQLESNHSLENLVQIKDKLDASTDLSILLAYLSQAARVAIANPGKAEMDQSSLKVAELISKKLESGEGARDVAALTLEYEQYCEGLVDIKIAGYNLYYNALPWGTAGFKRRDIATTAAAEKKKRSGKSVQISTMTSGPGGPAEGIMGGIQQVAEKYAQDRLQILNELAATLKSAAERTFHSCVILRLLVKVNILKKFCPLETIAVFKTYIGLQSKARQRQLSGAAGSDAGDKIEKVIGIFGDMIYYLSKLTGADRVETLKGQNLILEYTQLLIEWSSELSSRPASFYHAVAVGYTALGDNAVTEKLRTEYYGEALVNWKQLWSQQDIAAEHSEPLLFGEDSYLSYSLLLTKTFHAQPAIEIAREGCLKHPRSASLMHLFALLSTVDENYPKTIELLSKYFGEFISNLVDDNLPLEQQYQILQMKMTEVACREKFEGQEVAIASVSDVLHVLGAFFNMDLWNDAAQFYKVQIKREVWIWISELYIRAHLHEEARQAVREVSESGWTADLKSVHAMTLVESNPRAALKEFQAALEMEKLNARAIVGFANLVLSVKESLFDRIEDYRAAVAEARVLLELYLEHDGSDPLASSALSRFYEAIDDDDAADAAALKCLQILDAAGVRPYTVVESVF